MSASMTGSATTTVPAARATAPTMCGARCGCARPTRSGSTMITTVRVARTADGSPAAQAVPGAATHHDEWCAVTHHHEWKVPVRISGISGVGCTSTFHSCAAPPGPSGGSGRPVPSIPVGRSGRPCRRTCRRTCRLIAAPCRHVGLGWGHWWTSIVPGPDTFRSVARRHAPLAQLAEQQTLNLRVRGSSPWRRTKTACSTGTSCRRVGRPRHRTPRLPHGFDTSHSLSMFLDGPLSVLRPRGRSSSGDHSGDLGENGDVAGYQRFVSLVAPQRDLDA